MTISELVLALEAIRSQHGDVQVIIDDADTGWPLAIVDVEYSPKGSCVEIGGHYHNEENPERYS